MEEEQRVAQRNKALREAAEAARERVRAARAAQNAAAIQQAEAEAIAAGARAGEVCLFYIFLSCVYYGGATQPPREPAGGHESTAHSTKPPQKHQGILHACVYVCVCM